MQAHEADKGADTGAGAPADAVELPLWRQTIEPMARLLWSRVVQGVDRVVEFGADLVDPDGTSRVPGRPRQRISDADAAGLIGATLVLGSIALGLLLAAGAGLVWLVGTVRDSSVWAVAHGWHGFSDGVDWLASGPGAPVTAYLTAHSQELPWTGEQLLLGWATTGLVLWVLAAGTVRAAQLAWPLYVAATAAMAYQGTAGPSAPVVAGIVAVAGLVLAVPALRRGAVTSTRVVVAAPAPVPAVRRLPLDTLPPDLANPTYTNTTTSS